jgi:hypothetical protein
VLALVAGIMVTGARPVSAAYTGNLAGRPMGGYADAESHGQVGPNGCMGTAYGRVNGYKVLFTAGHCEADPNSGGPGAAVYAPDGSVLGWWGVNNTGAEQHDLAWVKLAGNFPSNPNQIYRGDYGTVDWWTINGQPTKIDGGCGTGPSAYDNVALFQNWQLTTSTTYVFRSGFGVGWGYFDGHQDSTNFCTINTSILAPLWSNGTPARSSGAPIIEVGHATVMGISSHAFSQDGGATWYMNVTPLFEGMYAVNYYYTHNGYTQGAYLCYTASCP